MITLQCVVLYIYTILYIEFGSFVKGRLFVHFKIQNLSFRHKLQSDLPSPLYATAHFKRFFYSIIPYLVACLQHSCSCCSPHVHVATLFYKGIKASGLFTSGFCYYTKSWWTQYRTVILVFLSYFIPVLVAKKMVCTSTKQESWILWR